MSLVNNDLIIGVDEAGRGPLAGPVVAAAVIFKPGKIILGVKDSKVLSLKKRESLYDLIFQEAWSIGIGIATVEEIDQINILQGSLLAMKRAVNNLNIPLDQIEKINQKTNQKTNQKIKILVDGNKLPDWDYCSEAIIKGDSKIPEISAASIIAKVTRDRLMLELDQQFPVYNFAKHSGYPTAEHRELLIKYGPCEHHRKTFGPVKELLAKSNHFIYETF